MKADTALATTTIDGTSVEITEELLKSVSDIVNSPDIRNTDLQDEKRMVVMSNNFVVGIETGSRLAHKISRICIAQIRAQDTELPVTRITSEDMLDMGYTRERLTGHANDVIDEILSLRIKLSTLGRIQGTSRLTGINVFSAATILPGEGAILVQLNPTLKEHFLHLSQDYTSYEMQVAMRMNSIAASKLHELLICRSRQFNASLLEFDIKDLAALLGYKPKKKKKEFSPSDFVNSTLKRAVQAINEVTECRVKYYAVKTGRKITSVRFFVESNWRSVKEKEENIEWEREMETDGTIGAVLAEQNEKTIYVLESGQGCIFPEDVAEANAKKSRTS